MAKIFSNINELSEEEMFELSILIKGERYCRQAIEHAGHRKYDGLQAAPLDLKFIPVVSNKDEVCHPPIDLKVSPSELRF